MTVARLMREMPSAELTEWEERDRLDAEDAATGVAKTEIAAHLAETARAGLPRRGHHRARG